MFNFCEISTSDDRSSDHVRQLNRDSHALTARCFFSSSSRLDFPWSIDLIALHAFDLFLSIETFVKVTALNSSEYFIDSAIVRHLSACEKQIIEKLAWRSDSPVWSQIESLKLSENFASQSQLLFPLFQDVFPRAHSTLSANSPGQFSTNLCPSPANQNSGTLISSGTGELILTLTPNPESRTSSVAAASSFASPAKHPTITRVVCSTDNNVSPRGLQISNVANSKFQLVTVNNAASKSARINRLANLNNSLAFFFRKFYNLANSRIREMVEKIESTQLGLSPLIQTNGQESPVLNSHMTTETQQMLIKKIWHIFETSISHSSNCSKSNLLFDRHLDQLILCCFQTVCKLNSLPVSFSDILRVYRSTWSSNVNKSDVYRLVRQTDKDSFGDIIQFYNEYFIQTLKSEILSINELLLDEGKKSTVYGGSPLSNIQFSSIYGQFTPRKVIEGQAVSISPSKAGAASIGAQPIQQRNKMIFSLKDFNPTKVTELNLEILKFKFTKYYFI